MIGAGELGGEGWTVSLEGRSQTMQVLWDKVRKQHILILQGEAIEGL